MKRLLPALLLACADDPARSGSKPDSTEPLDLPADPAEPGAPVGVRTFEHEGLTLEVWYPTTDDQAAAETESADLQQFIPESVTAVLGEVPLDGWDTGAVRDAPVRDAGAPLPAVLFSHGLGGFRLQSTDLTVHLASRGYIVVAPDHPGRMLGDVLPCVFSPPLEGCDLSGFGSDPGVEDMALAFDWLEGAAEAGDLAGRIDLDHIALVGHSAGGGTTGTVGEQDTRLDALISMAAGPVVDREVPLLLLGGTCDGIVPIDSIAEAATESGQALRVDIEGAGHLAFSNLCSLELGRLSETLLEPRDDVNEALLPQLVLLATDGCPGETPQLEREECAEAWLPLETSDPILRHLLTVFLDQHLKGEGEGVQAGQFSEATVFAR